MLTQFNSFLMTEWNWVTQSGFKGQFHAVLFCLHLADPATFQLQTKFWGTYFPLNAACLFSYRTNKCLSSYHYLISIVNSKITSSNYAAPCLTLVVPNSQRAEYHACPDIWVMSAIWIQTASDYVALKNRIIWQDATESPWKLLPYQKSVARWELCWNEVVCLSISTEFHSLSTVWKSFFSRSLYSLNLPLEILIVLTLCEIRIRPLCRGLMNKCLLRWNDRVNLWHKRSPPNKPASRFEFKC